MKRARLLFFFFQAEDGIRDVAVTGVQTCALPIWDDAEQARVEVGRAVGEQMDQDDGRHQWKEEEDEHEVLQRADAAEDPDDRDDDQGHHPGVRQEERRDQKADDEDELGAWIEAVEERVASRELVEELHAYTSFIRTGAGGWRRGPRAR